MPVIYRERKFHFGIISQGEKEKLQEIIRLQDEKFRKRAKNELDECEEVVSRFLSEKADRTDLKKLKNMIDGYGKCVSREIQWCRPGVGIQTARPGPTFLCPNRDSPISTEPDRAEKNSA